MHANEVAEVASFYSLFNLPGAGGNPGLHQRAVLPGVARAAWCASWSAARYQVGTATPDGRFAIAEVECLVRARPRP